MTEYPDDNQIRETDIVFDCPYCGKSLAIDYRGAGLNVQCTDCGRNVSVPIPEGMEISDLDSSREEQEIRILNLRRALSMAEERINELEDELEDLHSRRAILEKDRVESQGRYGAIVEQMNVIQDAQERILELLSALAGEAGETGVPETTPASPAESAGEPPSSEPQS